MGGAGTTTSALAFGGTTPSITAITESWNGTNWTEVGDLNVARKEIGGAGASNTSAIGFGGEQPPNTDSTATEEWNKGPVTVTFDVS